MNWLIRKAGWIAPLALLLFTTNAFAASQTGQILLRVMDEAGNPVAGAKVELSSPTLIGGVKEVMTDDSGTHRFIELPPGSYKVVVTKDGLRPYTAAETQVNINTTVNLNVPMQAAAGDDVEEIIVSGMAPVVDTERLTMGATITDTFTETVPTNRTYQGLAQLVPGVTGGANPNVMGGTLYGNQYLLDGINITDPVTNTFSANFNFDAIQSVEILTGARDAEYGSAVGGVINIVTKSGSNEFEADVSVYYDSNHTQPFLEEDEKDQDNLVLTVNANVGGPIIKDKLWYFVSAEMPWTKFTLPAPEGGSVFPDREGENHPARTYLGLNALGKLTYQFNENQVFKLLVQGDPAEISNTKQDPTVHPDAEREQVQTGYVISAISETFLSEDMFWSNRLAWSTNRLEIQPESGDFDTPGRTNTGTGTDTVNDTIWLDDKRMRLQYQTALSYMVDDFFGEHQFKAGFDLSLTWNDVFDSLPGGRSYIDNGTDPNDPNSISGAGLPDQEVRLIEAQDTTIFGDHEAVYLQDVWKPFTWLTVRPGLRYDTARMRNFEGETQMALNTFSPRIGVAWDPFDDGKTQLKAGYYQYIDTGFLALSDFAGGRSRLTRTYDYNPITGEYDLFRTETGGENGVEGKDYLKDSWNQQRPRTHEVNVGLARELAADLMLGLNFVYRRAGNQWEDDESNVLWNEAGDSAIGFVNGESRFIYDLGAMEEAFIRYIGVTVEMNKRFSKNWEMLASYTYSRTQGTEPGIITVAFDRPRQREFEYGWLPFDRRHDLKVYASYRLPYGVVLGGRVRYLSGAPYNRFVFNGFYSDYNDRTTERGYDLNDEGEKVALRLPDTFTLNARVMWQLEEIIDQRIDLIVEGTNLFNARTPVAYETRDLPAGGATAFGDVTDKLNSTTFTFGLRYRY